MGSSDDHPRPPARTALEAAAGVDRRLIVLSPQDNVCVACTQLAAGDAVLIDGAAVTLRQSIPLGHKLARRPIHTGERITKYGAPIGSATMEIAVGAHVHLHNLKSDYIPSFGVDAGKPGSGGRGE